jgi:hypothetical protein
MHSGANKVSQRRHQPVETETTKHPNVIPAKAGIQAGKNGRLLNKRLTTKRTVLKAGHFSHTATPCCLDSGLRRNDGVVGKTERIRHFFEPNTLTTNPGE